MALIAVVSAKGSPGATTLAVTLAGVHPRLAVVADLDPAGGDLAWRYRRADGEPLDSGLGLLSLGVAVRHGQVDGRPHLQQITGGLEVLTGVASPEQVTALGPVWPNVAQVLAEMPERDVFADCGRYAPGSPVTPVLAGADAIIVVVRDRIDQLAHLRERVRALCDVAGAARLAGVPIGVVVVADERARGVADDVRRLLDAAGLPATVLGTMADDPKGAAALGSGASATVARSLLVRSVRALSPQVQRLAARGGVMAGG